MGVHFLAKDLGRWDRASGDALVLTIFADERPLRGAAGLADWRLCGRLSRLIERRRVAGDKGEALMMPPGRRLPWERIMLFGLGRSSGFDEHAFRVHARWIADVLERANVLDYAVQPPGRASGLIAARRALELWLEAAQPRGEMHVIDAPGAQKEMADVLRMHAVRSAVAAAETEPSEEADPEDADVVTKPGFGPAAGSSSAGTQEADKPVKGS